MKTRFKLLIALLLIFIPASDASALSCAPVALGDAFEESEFAFHGKVVDKNYLTWDHQMPVVTFEIIESFKGNADQKISVTVYEQWSYDFEVGLEYVVFVNRIDLSLEISPCSPMFQAFPSTIDIMHLASLPDHDMRHQTSIVFYESLSDIEKIQFEKNNEFLKEKRAERWENSELQKNIILVLFLSLGPIGGFVSIKVLRKRK